MTVEARSYESPLRAEQRDATRNRILEAAVEQLADEGAEELTIPLVARRAGVSVRTVYVHFPTKDALFEAVSELLDDRIGAIHFPDKADDLPSFVAAIFGGFDRDEPLFTGALRTKAGREVSARRRPKRIQELEKALEPELRGLEPLERRQAFAAVYIAHSVGSWRSMKDYFGLTGSQAGDAAAWAVRAMLRELRRNPGKLEGAPGASRTTRGDEQRA